MANKNPVINGLKTTLGYIELFPVLAVAAYEKNKGEGDQSPAMLLGLISVLLIVPAVAALVRYVAQAFKKDDNLTIRNALLPAAANCTNNSNALSSPLAMRLKEDIGLHNSTFLKGGFTGLAQGVVNAAGNAASELASGAQEVADLTSEAASTFWTKILNTTGFGAEGTTGLQGGQPALTAAAVGSSSQSNAALPRELDADKLGAAQGGLKLAKGKLQRAERALNRTQATIKEGRSPESVQQFKDRIPGLESKVVAAKAEVKVAERAVKAASPRLWGKTPGRGGPGGGR